MGRWDEFEGKGFWVSGERFDEASPSLCAGGVGRRAPVLDRRNEARHFGRFRPSEMEVREGELKKVGTFESNGMGEANWGHEPSPGKALR